MTHPWQPPRWQTWWPGLLLACMAALLSWSGGIARLDYAVYDTSQRVWPAPTPDDVVMVAIDDTSLKALGRWPWKRSTHASLLNRIQTYHPKAVLLHLLLSEPDADAQQDDALTKALASFEPKVVLPLGFVQTPDGQTTPLRPLDAFAAQAELGHAQVSLDADGVVRTLHLRAGWPQQSWDHVILALLPNAPISSADHATSLATSSATPEGNWFLGHPVRPRFAGPTGSIRTVSYVDVLAGRIPGDAFTNRTVLIGATAQGLGDRYLTPTTSGGQTMPSVEVIAQALGALEQNKQVDTLPAWAHAVVTASLIMLLFCLYWSRPPRQGLVMAVVSVVLLPALSVLMMGMGIWFAPSAFIAVAALSYPLWSWRRLEVASQYLTAQLERHAVTTTSAGKPWLGHLERQALAIETLHARTAQAYELVNRLVDQLPCAVVLVDGAGVVVRANRAFLALLDLPEPGAIQGVTLARLLHDWQPSESSTWDKLLQHASTIGAPPFETRGPDGQVCLTSVVPTPPDHPHAQGGAIICLLDVTGNKQAERQRDELLGFIAHDIRSPQASLLSLVELHRMSPQSMPTPELLAHVDNLARGTLALSEELIHVMRSESRPLQLQQASLAHLLESACLLTQPQALAKHIDLKVSCADKLDTHCTLDEGLVQRAIMNLLTNAIRFSPEHSTIEIRLSHEAESWRIEVQDHGEGMSADHLSRLFRRNSKVPPHTEGQQNKGFGLGLVFVDTVFRRHGGSVRVESTPGQGSTFICHLPQG